MKTATGIAVIGIVVYLLVNEIINAILRQCG